MLHESSPLSLLGHLALIAFLFFTQQQPIATLTVCYLLPTCSDVQSLHNRVVQHSDKKALTKACLRGSL